MRDHGGTRTLGHGDSAWSELPAAARHDAPRRARFLAMALLTLLSFLVIASGETRASAATCVGSITGIQWNPGPYVVSNTFTGNGTSPIAQIGFNWAVDNGSLPGDTFSLTIPTQLRVASADFNLTLPSGTVVANGVWSGKTLTFTLTSAVTGLSNISGTAFFTVGWDLAGVGTTARASGATYSLAIDPCREAPTYLPGRYIAEGPAGTKQSSAKTGQIFLSSNVYVSDWAIYVRTAEVAVTTPVVITDPGTAAFTLTCAGIKLYDRTPPPTFAFNDTLQPTSRWSCAPGPTGIILTLNQMANGNYINPGESLMFSGVRGPLTEFGLSQPTITNTITITGLPTGTETRSYTVPVPGAGGTGDGTTATFTITKTVVGTPPPGATYTFEYRCLSPSFATLPPLSAGQTSAPITTGSTATCEIRELGLASNQTVGYSFITAAGATLTPGANGVVTVNFADGVNSTVSLRATNTYINPAIDLVKVADISSYSVVGQQIPYTLTSTNTGDATLTNVTISDPKLSPTPIPCAASLAPGASCTVTGTYTVTLADLQAGKVTNVATTTGTPPGSLPPPTDTATAEVPATPALTIVKQVLASPTADPSLPASWVDANSPTYPVYAMGQTVSYRILVTNTSTTAVNGVSVSDALPTGVTYVPNSTQVSVPSPTTVASDNFNTNTFTGGTGWAATQWSTSGTPTVTGGEVFMNGGSTRAVTRLVNLAGRTAATLSFSWRCTDDATGSGWELSDTLSARVSYNGGAYQTLWTRNGDQVCAGAGQTASGSETVPLNLAASTNVYVHLTSVTDSSTEDVYWDNVVITDPTTQTTAAGHAPPGLVIPADGYNLAPGGSMTVTYKVTVNGGTPGTLTNTATATSTQTLPVSDPASITTTGYPISGNVFNDTNGGYVNSPQPVNVIPSGLWVSILNASGTVVATVSVPTTGVWSTTVPPGTYTAVVSTTQGVVGSPAPALALPSGWGATGEFTGPPNTGNDGLINQTSTPFLVNAAVTNINFGIASVECAVAQAPLQTYNGQSTADQVLANNVVSIGSSRMTATTVGINATATTNMISDTHYTGEAGLRIGHADGDATGPTDYLKTTVNFSLPITDLAFRIHDIDAGDILTVNVYDAAGNIITLTPSMYTLLAGASSTVNSVTGNRFSSSTVDADNNTRLGTVDFDYAGYSVSKIEILYWDTLGSGTYTLSSVRGEACGASVGQLVVTKDAVPNSAQDFSFTTTGIGLSGFLLDDDSNATLPNTRTFNYLAAGSYTVTEGVTAGWNLTGLVCSDPDNGSTVNLLTRTANIDIDAGEIVSCTFTNEPPKPMLIQKVGESATGTVVPMTGSSWAVLADNGGTPGASVLVPSAVSGQVGLFRIEGLAPGTYWLTETQAPAGFALLAEPVQFTVAANGTVTLGTGTAATISVVTDVAGFVGVRTIRVMDVPKRDLPESGGPGVSWFHAGGAAVLAVGLLLALRRREARG